MILPHHSRVNFYSCCLLGELLLFFHDNATCSSLVGISLTLRRRIADLNIVERFNAFYFKLGWRVEPNFTIGTSFSSICLQMIENGDATFACRGTSEHTFSIFNCSDKIFTDVDFFCWFCVFLRVQLWGYIQWICADLLDIVLEIFFEVFSHHLRFGV